MVIIRLNPLLRMRQVIDIEESIRKQAETGIIILPEYAELLNEVPADEEIKVISQGTPAATTQQHGTGERCRFCRGVEYTPKSFKVITQTAAVVDTVFNYCPVCGTNLKGED